MSGNEVDQYINRMRQDGTFGEGIALSAAAKRFNRPIVIFAPETSSHVQHVNLPGTDDFERPGPAIYLGLFSEHYISINSSRLLQTKLVQQVKCWWRCCAV